MPFKKGHKLAKGRPKEAPNKNTKDIKEAFKVLVENNLDNMTNWLNDIAKDDPNKAMGIIIELSERFVAKLSRTELTGKDGKDLNSNNINISYNGEQIDLKK